MKLIDMYTEQALTRLVNIKQALDTYDKRISEIVFPKYPGMCDVVSHNRWAAAYDKVDINYQDLKKWRSEAEGELTVQKSLLATLLNPGCNIEYNGYEIWLDHVGNVIMRKLDE